MKSVHNIILVFILLAGLVSSCIDKDYDWDNLDKTATINVGNVPLGDIKKLTIESLFSDDLRAQLKVGNDGILYLEYIGDLDIHDPDTEVPDTDPVSIETITLPIPGSTIALPKNETFNVVENDPVSYTISEPFFDDVDWEIMVTSVDFKSCNFIPDVSFSGLSFSDTGSDKARVEVDIKFPHNIALKEQSSKTIKRTFNLSDLNNGKITLPAIPLASIDYADGVQDLIYSVTIFGGGNTQLTAAAGTFNFDLTFRTENVIPDIIYGDVKFNQAIDGHIDDLKELNDAFPPEIDVMKFADIQLYLNLNTNLGANMTVGVDRLSTGNSGQESSLHNLTADRLIFTKPEINSEKRTSYLLAKNNPEGNANFIQTDLTPLFDIIPAWLDYEMSVHNNNIDDKSAFFLYGRHKVEADYRFVLPFSFSELDMHLADTLTDVFKDDLAEKIFYEAGEFKVVADEAIVDFGHTEADALNVITQVSLLDRNMKKIDVEVKPVTLKNGSGQPLEIKIEIKDSDISKLQEAMHLSFDFDITNAPGKILNLRNTDSIEIKGVKFQSTSGIKFDLE